MREIRTQLDPLFESEAVQAEGRLLSFTARQQIEGDSHEIFVVESAVLSAPEGGSDTVVDSTVLNSPLELNFEEQDSDSTIDLALSTSSIISTSITDSQNVLSDWGIGEGLGTGDVGDIGSGHGCGCQCESCQGGGSSSFSGNGGSGTNAAGAMVNLDQVVFLDFESGTDGNVDYTESMRAEVQFQMETIYAQFGVTFVQVEPTEGDYSTLVFNRGSQGGLAEDIDFRNQNKNDNAVLNVIRIEL